MYVWVGLCSVHLAVVVSLSLTHTHAHTHNTTQHTQHPKVLDHVGIYLLIAGSYSPFMMIALHHNTPANVLLVVEWLTAFIGICVSIGTAGVDISNQATNLVEVSRSVRFSSAF
jgi:hemolysin III